MVSNDKRTNKVVLGEWAGNREDGGQMSTFAATILRNKYAQVKASGERETWGEVAERVATSVVGPYLPEMVEPIRRLIAARKLMPGGRYLYAAGRRYPQISNCFMLMAEDARDGPGGWADTMRVVTSALMTGGGVGVVYSKLRPEGYSVRGMGGKSTGPLALMRMVNEAGRYIMQGGSRRSALWAGLHWNHPDILRFIALKDWSDSIRTARTADYNFPAPMDGTNISVILDTDFFRAMEGASGIRKWSWGEAPWDKSLAESVYALTTRHMVETGEPGFSVDTGDNDGEHLRNAPVAGGTHVYTWEGYQTISDIVGKPVMLWTGRRWAKDVVFRKTAEMVPTVRVRLSNGKHIIADPTHLFLVYRAGPDPYEQSQFRSSLRPPTVAHSGTTITRIPAGDLMVGEDLVTKGAETVRVVSVTPSPPEDVYCCDVGLEEHCFVAEGVIIANCTEVTTRDNGDNCNLASINLARIRSVEELHEVAQAGIAFLMCGTLYGVLPSPEMEVVREKNRRIGLGLMGVHEWLLRSGYRYEMNDKLRSWMRVYKETTTSTAKALAARLGIAIPIATRSIAPTGTISIVAETTSGIEPIFAAAFKRRYLDGVTWKAQYVIDSTARRLIDLGVDLSFVEDAYTLSEDIDRRVAFQRDMQAYVDQGIASTINLPQWGSSINNPSTVDRFARTLLGILPTLRGITAYPDGARGGQPLNRVPYTTALAHLGREFTESADTPPLSSPLPPKASNPESAMKPAPQPTSSVEPPWCGNDLAAGCAGVLSHDDTPISGTPVGVPSGPLPIPSYPFPLPTDAQKSALPSEVDSAHAVALDNGGDGCKNGFCAS